MIKLDPNVVLAAREGNRAALEEIARCAQRPVFNLAMRMLANRSDAEDATQEILVKIITHLGTVQDVGAAGGWALKVASRHLVRERRRGQLESMRLEFNDFAEDLADGAVSSNESGLSEPEFALAVNEVKIGCTLAMLVCLSRDLRIAYILGEIFELSDTEASSALEISAAAFRQRLRRARDKVTGFVSQTCGIAGAIGACHCERRVVPALKQGRIGCPEAKKLSAARAPVDINTLRRQVQSLEGSRRSAGLMRTNPDFSSGMGELVARVLDELREPGPQRPRAQH
ncbi:RNA polymerase ECF-type sigma factor [Pseudooceanicola batsensis HTCC2597]|uniref:RNA polymerase ECF-type sigma factor n=1 Tax=Pseudooceanicola batsensis (strain ATCC BAA-863 / DSM 15984 / KCTC 12145 / HTCC2597) TaxID=252305 RepID=A3TZJ3_PSEBH|nr:RNA polymerase sigma factor [Pseudooceanicola batsensis]EAQ02474.1 RNA polymerase ECF-type sigma factor [Pseudooceanicola batsensis HTCC2597]